MLITVARELMHGVLYLLSGSRDKCWTHWLHATHLCFSTYQYDIVERLYVMLFPRDFVTMEEHVQLSLISKCDRNTDAINDTARCVYQNFAGFYHTAALFRFWWEAFPKLRTGMKKTDQDSDKLDHVVVVETAEMRNADSGNMLKIYGEWIARLVDTRFPCTKIQLKDVFNLLSSMSALLLSETYARISQMRLRIADSDQKLMETRIRKQLRQHIKNRAEEIGKKEKSKIVRASSDKGSSSGAASKGSASDANWRTRESTKVDDADAASCIDSKSNDAEVNDAKINGSNMNDANQNDGKIIDASTSDASTDDAKIADTNSSDASCNVSGSASSQIGNSSLDLSVMGDDSFDLLAEENDALKADLNSIPDEIKVSRSTLGK